MVRGEVREMQCRIVGHWCVILVKVCFIADGAETPDWQHQQVEHVKVKVLNSLYSKAKAEADTEVEQEG